MAQLLKVDPDTNPNVDQSVQFCDESSVVLRKSGAKPLKLNGRMIAECSSWSASSSYWHDLTIYEDDRGHVHVGLRSCRGASGEHDQFQAKSFLNIDGATAWLQEYDATSDLPVDIDVSDRRMSAVEIALRAAVLRQRADRLLMQYRSMIGELLYQLEVKD